MCGGRSLMHPYFGGQPSDVYVVGNDEEAKGGLFGTLRTNFPFALLTRAV